MTPAQTAQNQVLGKGKLFFAQFASGTTTPGGERYLGNTPAFSLSNSAETLDHFNSDEGIKQKDKSVPLSTTRSGQFETDHIDPRNVALFFFGSASTLTVAGSTALTGAFADVEKGLYYQIGIDTTNPSGVRKVSNVVLKKGATTLVLDTDYKLDTDLARIEILTGSVTITNGDDLTITYDQVAHTRDQIISGSQPVEGAMRFIGFNPEGKNVDYYIPYIKLSPNGDYALKGDDWQKIPFNVEALLKAGEAAALYADGRPA